MDSTGAHSILYPRVCGGTSTTAPIASAPIGLSPRVRGNLDQAVVDVILIGSIPACAGEPAGCRI